MTGIEVDARAVEKLLARPVPGLCVLRAAAQDRAVAGGAWSAVAQCRFGMPVRHAPHQDAQGAHFTRPMHVRLLRKAA